MMANLSIVVAKQKSAKVPYFSFFFIFLYFSLLFFISVWGPLSYHGSMTTLFLWSKIVWRPGNSKLFFAIVKTAGGFFQRLIIIYLVVNK